MNGHIRRASARDAAGINAVYNPFIKDSPATFETTAITTDARLAWLKRLEADPRHPVFVAEDGDDRQIIGFANAAAFDERTAYETSVKVSVFVAPSAAGRGVGRGLYTKLMAALAGEDIHRAYGLIVAPNPASVALHEAFGFRHVATLDEVGRKFGAYHSVMWFEKRF